MAAIEPTQQFYDWLRELWTYFNRELFDGALDPVMLTVQREKQTMGYFSPNRWGHREGATTHEIAINPAYWAHHTLLEICQTVVHEQVHQWQHQYGTPSRAGYHNREWADKMESVGLIPSDTGRPGGKRTGQTMSDYPAAVGPFLIACHQMPDSLDLSWMDLRPADSRPCQDRLVDEDELPAPLGTVLGSLMPDLADSYQEHSTSKRKTKYQCAGCDSRVWGKPDLDIRCGVCDLPFDPLT